MYFNWIIRTWKLHGPCLWYLSKLSTWREWTWTPRLVSTSEAPGNHQLGIPPFHPLHRFSRCSYQAEKSWHVAILAGHETSAELEWEPSTEISRFNSYGAIWSKWCMIMYPPPFSKIAEQARGSPAPSVGRTDEQTNRRTKYSCFLLARSLYSLIV
jgi:hypothetical protein